MSRWSPQPVASSRAARPVACAGKTYGSDPCCLRPPENNCNRETFWSRSDAPPDLKRPVAGTNGTLPMHFYIHDSAPYIETDETDFGARVISLRKAEEGQTYFRVLNFILPSICTVVGPMGGDGYYMFWHVPIDDTRHWRYEIMFRRSGRWTTEIGKESGRYVRKSMKVTFPFATKPTTTYRTGKR